MPANLNTQTKAETTAGAAPFPLSQTPITPADRKQ